MRRGRLIIARDGREADLFLGVFVVALTGKFPVNGLTGKLPVKVQA